MLAARWGQNASGARRLQGPHSLVLPESCHTLLRRRRADRCDEPVALSEDGVDELRPIGGVAEPIAQTTDGAVQPVLGIDQGVIRPQPLAEFVASDEAASALQHNARRICSDCSARRMRRSAFRSSPVSRSNSN
jgi:hypothetical protein